MVGGPYGVVSELEGQQERGNIGGGRTVAVAMGKWFHPEDTDPINKYLEGNRSQIS